MSIASLPHTLWHLYLDNLVYYKHGSWVDSVASTCRILAFVIIIPFILLTLLDVASYVIARTLGVIDETKASTSGELETRELQKTQPTIVINDADSSSDNIIALATSTPLPPESSEDDVDGNYNLKLSGFGTFSPAPSQPGSPTLQRREFVQHQFAHYGQGSLGLGLGLGGGGGGGGQDGQEDSDDGGRAEEDRSEFERGLRLRHGGDVHGDEEGGSGATTPRDPSGHISAGSSSGDSSYAILDRDSGSGSEDAGVVLRRRTRQ